MFDFKLPELGENIESGNVVAIMVNVGDTVSKDQDLFELETDKASLPVPSPIAGEVKEILMQVGDDIKVGQVVMKIEAGAEAEQATPPAETPTPSEPETPEPPAAPTPETTPSTPAAPSTPAPASSPSLTPPAPVPTAKSVVVIGGGPGGYAAAFLAADLGLEVTLIDLDANPGGVCLYRGCIPSKALLHAAKVLSEAREAQHFGIEFGRPKIHLDKLRSWKESIVNKLTGGLGQLSKQRKINFIRGRAQFIDSNTLKVHKEDESSEEVKFEKAILATGSHPITLPFAPISSKVLDSTGALELENVPMSMLVIGGGYIGLELGTVYAELGSDVKVVEMTPGLLPGADRDLANVLSKRAKNLFKDILLETKVTKMTETHNGIEVTFETKDGNSSIEEFEKVLVAIGRRPNSANLGLENTKVQITEKGFVRINPQCLTDDPNIYAIGDIAGEPMLAHKASHEGRVAVESILGHKVAFEPNAIPAVVFTDPEIAWCGLTETEAKAQGREVEIAKFPWGASGRALTLDRPDGVTKLIIDKKTHRILGVAMAGVGAGELISEGVLAVEMGALAEDLKLSIHPHPTISETVMEAAESFFGHSTHIYRPKKK